MSQYGNLSTDEIYDGYGKFWCVSPHVNFFTPDKEMVQRHIYPRRDDLKPGENSPLIYIPSQLDDVSYFYKDMDETDKRFIDICQEAYRRYGAFYMTLVYRPDTKLEKQQLGRKDTTNAQKG